MSEKTILSRRPLFMAVALSAAVALLLTLSGCITTNPQANDASQGADNSQSAAAPQGRSTEDAPSQDSAQGDVVSTAMVVYNDGKTVLFADQDTGSLYYPTLTGTTGDPDDVLRGLDGDDIDLDELAVGNIVRVTGNGIMLESYPGQYPGITKVEVIERGNPSDADQYAEEISQVIVTPDPADVPSSYVEYTTDMAQASVLLEAYEYEWVVPQNGDRKAGEQELEGSADDRQGVIKEGINDARVSGPVEALVGFSVAPTNVVVERTPLVNTSTPAIDPRAEDQLVPVTVQADGSVTFTMEPNYLYEIDADFSQGEASYAFYTLS